MQNEMPIGAQIFLALQIDKSSKLRRRAATIVARYVREFHLYGWNPGHEHFVKVCRRFRLGDFAEALQAHFPPRTK